MMSFCLSGAALVSGLTYLSADFTSGWLLVTLGIAGMYGSASLGLEPADPRRGRWALDLCTAAVAFALAVHWAADWIYLRQWALPVANTMVAPFLGTLSAMPNANGDLWVQTQEGGIRFVASLDRIQAGAFLGLGGVAIAAAVAWRASRARMLVAVALLVGVMLTRYASGVCRIAEVDNLMGLRGANPNVAFWDVHELCAWLFAAALAMSYGLIATRIQHHESEGRLA